MKSSPAVRVPCGGRPLFLLLACTAVACSAPAERSAPAAELESPAATPAPTAADSWRATEDIPPFDAFPVDSVFTGEPAPVDLGSHPMAGRYRTALRLGAAEGPNFAGHLTVVSWGCGSGCQMNAVVDARTGFVHPQTLITKQRVKHRLDSRLLIADPSDPELDPEGCPACVTTAAYVWRGSRFEPVRGGEDAHLSTLR